MLRSVWSLLQEPMGNQSSKLNPITNLGNGATVASPGRITAALLRGRPMLGQPRPIAAQDPDDDRKMALWKIYMTEQDMFRGEAAKDFAHCRKSAWASLMGLSMEHRVVWAAPLHDGQQLDGGRQDVAEVCIVPLLLQVVLCEKPVHVETAKEKLAFP